MVDLQKIILILFFSIALIQNATCQSKSVSFDVFSTQSDTYTINSVLQDYSILDFKHPSVFTKISPNDIYWIRINLENLFNENSTDSIYFLSMATFNKASLYTSHNNNIEVGLYGTFQVKDSRQLVIPINRNHLFNNKYVYIKAQRLTNRVPVSKLKIVVLDRVSNYYFQKYIPHSTKNELITNYFFVGICMLIMFIATLLYLIYRKTEYIFYTLNIACLMIYFSRNFSEFYILLFGSKTLLNYYITILLEVLIYTFYFQFIKYYLNTKTVYPLFHKSLNAALFFLLLVTAGMLASLYAQNFKLNLMLLDLRIIVISIYTLSSLIYLFIFLKSKATYFVIIGSLSYFIGALLLFVFYDNKFLIYCVIIEIIIFGIGLGYKLKLEYKEKQDAQQQAINHYSSALRAQMNPHFIFNSLNSIQYLILQKNNNAALKYLSKFSQLMRGTMENSINNYITLEDEIKQLKTYLDIESLRFNHSFNYQIECDENMDISSIEIPTLLIQPFVENALIHGLNHKTSDDKQIKILFNDYPEYLECRIEDNGIGRVASKEKRLKNQENKNKSRAIELTEKRLQSLKTNMTLEEYIIINDLYDKNQIAVGTQVIVKIPKN